MSIKPAPRYIDTFVIPREPRCPRHLLQGQPPVLLASATPELTFHHPWLEVWDSNNWGNTQSGNSGNCLVHGSICEAIINEVRLPRVGCRTPELGLMQADSLPSILPCSQSTMTQSAPDLARTLETLAPGSICQNPMAGRLASAKTCLSRFDFNMLECVPVVDTKRSSRVAVRCEGRLMLLATAKNDDR